MEDLHVNYELDGGGGHNGDDVDEMQMQDLGLDHGNDLVVDELELQDHGGCSQMSDLGEDDDHELEMIPVSVVGSVGGLNPLPPHSAQSPLSKVNSPQLVMIQVFNENEMEQKEVEDGVCHPLVEGEEEEVEDGHLPRTLVHETLSNGGVDGEEEPGILMHHHQANISNDVLLSQQNLGLKPPPPPLPTPHKVMGKHKPLILDNRRSERPKRRRKTPNNKYLEDFDSSDEEVVEIPPPAPPPSSQQQPQSKRKRAIQRQDMIEGEINFESSGDEEIKELSTRKCGVCLRRRPYTEDVIDQNTKGVASSIQNLISHLKIKDTIEIGKDVGICPECMHQLQRWHIFQSAISKRHESAGGSGESWNDEPLAVESIENRVYRNYKKMVKVKEVYYGATHAHFARRNLNDKDWDFFCDHLFRSNSVKSVKSKELERFINSREKLSSLFCNKCQKLIPDGKKGYGKHMESTHGEYPVLFPCDLCGLRFPEKDMTASTEDFYPHWISHFYFNKCEECSKNFPTKRALGQHKHAVHKDRSVTCEKCGKVLANKMSLDLHLLRHLPESEKKKYMIKCKICKKKIAQWNLKSHMATHNEDRPWKCDHCSATFKMKGALVSHRDVVHFNLKNHPCTICGEAFKSASSLRGHVRRHEGRRDYKCDVCLKEYYTYSALKGHKVVHQTARDFICDTCGKAFKKKKALEEHGTIHTGQKLHKCPICGREIRVKSNLYKHMKIHKKNSELENSELSSVSHNGVGGVRRRRKSGGVLKGTPVNSTTIQISQPTQVSSGYMTGPMLSKGNNSTGSNTILMISNNSHNQHHLVSNSNHVVVEEVEGEEEEQPQQQECVQQQDNFMNSPFRTITTIMQHQHQDLLNVPVSVSVGGYYNNPTQLFTPLDQLQN